MAAAAAVDTFGAAVTLVDGAMLVGGVISGGATLVS